MVAVEDTLRPASPLLPDAAALAAGLAVGIPRLLDLTVGGAVIVDARALRFEPLVRERLRIVAAVPAGGRVQIAVTHIADRPAASPVPGTGAGSAHPSLHTGQQQQHQQGCREERVWTRGLHRFVLSS